MPASLVYQIVYDPSRADAVEAWLDRWGPVLRSVSDDSGCGCCVHILDVDGAAEAFDALPPGVDRYEPRPTGP